MTSTTRRVLVTGARLPAALEIVRAIHACGVDVWAADTLRMTPAGTSNCASGYVRLPSPALEHSAFVHALVDAVRVHDITDIVPVSEEVFFVAAARSGLPQSVHVFAPDESLLRGLHSKWKVLELAAGCGVRIPATLLARTLEELRECVRQLPNCVLKPEFSRGAYAIRLPPHDEMPRVDARLFPWLVQERIAGRELSVCALAWRGEVHACASYEPRYRAGRGAALYFEPLRSRPAEDFVRAFARKYALSGHVSFDLVEERSGELVLLECNPRPTSGVHLFPGDGQWARACWGDVCATDRTRPTPAATATAIPACSKSAIVAMHALPALLRGEWCTMRADLRRADDVCYRRNDRWPAFAAPLCAAEIALRSLAWPTKLRHAFTFDLEWDGRPS